MQCSNPYPYLHPTILLFSYIIFFLSPGCIEYIILYDSYKKKKIREKLIAYFPSIERIENEK